MKIIKTFILSFIVLLVDSGICQESIIKFPHQDEDKVYVQSFILGGDDDNLLFFFVEERKILISKSSDNGINWSTPKIIFDSIAVFTQSDLKAVRDVHNRIYLVFRISTPIYIYSDDNGETWSFSNLLPGTNSVRFDLTYSKITDELLFVFSTLGSRLFLAKSTNRGTTWKEDEIFSQEGQNPSISVSEDGILNVFYRKSVGSSYRAVLIKSSDSGNTWSSPKEILSFNFIPPVMKSAANNNNLWFFYLVRKDILLGNGFQYDIEYIHSSNGGENWSEKNKFTTYTGSDTLFSVSIHNNFPIVSFASDRKAFEKFWQYKLYYTKPGTLEDPIPPPVFYSHFSEPLLIPEKSSFKIIAEVAGYLPFTEVYLDLYINDIFSVSIEMKDDGTDGDEIAGDSKYTAVLLSTKTGDIFYCVFNIKDIAGKEYSFKSRNFYIGKTNFDITYLLDVNRIKLPVRNNGILADANVQGKHGGRFDNISFLFSGGFFLSGYDNTELWASGVFSASLFSDFNPGITGSNPDDLLNTIYVVNKNDPPFGDSWQQWRFAVMQGADFYDGDGDGIYNPVDLNRNGVWDPFEDMPPLVGDEIAWCTYNDNQPSSRRRFSTVSSKGITIQQTLFAVSDSLTGRPYHKIIFLKYKIINTGTVSSVFDSVYFSVVHDPDIGEYYNDLNGYDIQTKSSFAYKNRSDLVYGDNPPSFFVSLLQGPHSFIPGETFIDNNSNGIFDPGTDTPLDTAYYKKSLLIDEIIIPGSKNLDVSSSVAFLMIGFHDPQYTQNVTALRNGHLGLRGVGIPLSPCDTIVGRVFGGENCNEINPYYHFSGDPVTKQGWIMTQPWDIRFMQNTGPFILSEDEPIEIIYAYIVGRGDSPLSSITDARSVAEFAYQVYNSNFKDISIDKNSLLSALPQNFYLSQNYPNPFNASTKIDYEVPVLANVEIKLYDILGREIKKISQGYKYPGKHTVIFELQNFASGVYFYQLRVNDFIETKKMILIK